MTMLPYVISQILIIIALVITAYLIARPSKSRSLLCKQFCNNPGFALSILLISLVFLLGLILNILDIIIITDWNNIKESIIIPLSFTALLITAMGISLATIAGILNTCSYYCKSCNDI